MKRKVAMQKLKNPKQTEQSKMKKIGKKTKENRKNVSEEKEGEESTQKEMVDREEIARKKAERQKKRVEQQKAKENREREKAVKEKERAALMERDNRILAEMNSFKQEIWMSKASSHLPIYLMKRSMMLTGLNPWMMMNILVEEILYLNVRLTFIPPSLFLPLPTLPNQLYKPQEQLLVEKDPGISPRVNHNFLQDQLWVEKSQGPHSTTAAKNVRSTRKS